MRKTSGSVILFLIVVFLSTVLACGRSSQTATGDNTASARVSIEVQAPSQAQSKALKSFIGTFNDVTSLTVDVLKGGVPLITGQQLTYSNGVWTGTLQNLPIGPSLTFIGHAYNASAVQIFTGTTVQAMTGNNDTVGILMAPVSDGVAAMFPKITRILLPAQIVTSTTTTISISVEASSGETLTYAAKAASGGGSFSPSSGTLTLGGTTGTLVLRYAAPSTAATYTHSIRVTNRQTNWVETDFSTMVSAATASASLSAQFAPVITAIGAKRSGSNVTFTAVVSDTGPLSAMTYSWGFSGGLTFVDNTTNPAVLQGYDETKSGNLTLTVTNGVGGATTVSYSIAPGLLPDNIQGTVEPAPKVVSAAATGTTTVVVTFDRTIDASSVVGNGSQFIFTGELTALAAVANGKTVTDTTSPQTALASYSVSVAGSIVDSLGSGVDAGANSASFLGYTGP